MKLRRQRFHGIANVLNIPVTAGLRLGTPGVAVVPAQSRDTMPGRAGTVVPGT